MMPWAPCSSLSSSCGLVALGEDYIHIHTWHPARFWFESEVEDCLVPVGAGTVLLVGCENEGCYMLLCWSLMRRSTLTSRVISKQKPLCVRTHRNWTFRSWSKSWCFCGSSKIASSFHTSFAATKAKELCKNNIFKKKVTKLCKMAWEKKFNKPTPIEICIYTITK